MKFGGRLLVSLLVAGAVAGGGMLLQSGLGARVPPRPSIPDEVSGAWFCPHGGGEGFRAWVVLANPGPEASDVRLTTYSAGRDPVATVATLEPGTHRYFEAAAPQMASATVVEFFRSEVGAGFVLAGPEGRGVAAEPCTAQAATTWFVPESSTLRGEEAHVIVFNPFATDAVAEVSLLAGDRILRPSAFKGVVLAQGESRVFALNRFALGEKALAVSVRALLGRVAASGVVVAKGGVRAVAAVAAPARTHTLPAAGDGPDGTLVVAAPSEAQAPFRAGALTAKGEVPALDLELLAGGTAASFPIDSTDAGLLVTADGARPFLAGRRSAPAPPEPPQPEPGTGQDRKKGAEKDARKEESAGPRDRKGGGGGPPPEPPPPADLASTGGASAPARRWVVLPAVPPEGGSAVLVLENPSQVPAEGTVTYLGEGGPRGEPVAVTVGPRSAVRLDVPPGPPLTAVVELTAGSVVAAQVALDPQRYAIAVGTPTD
jgi:Family of unknown function (DUF5719)